MSEEDPFLRHEPCPACGSKDNLARYQSGSAHCFGCDYHEHNDGSTTISTSILKIPGESKMDIARKISLSTNQKYKVTNWFNNNTE